MLSSGTVNMKRFERRQSELLVLSELLDRTVTLTEDGRRVEHRRRRHGAEPHQRLGDHPARRAQRRGRLTRRRGELFQVDWDEVDGLSLSESSQGTDTLLAVLAGMRPADVAAALQDMPDKRRA